MGVPPPLISLAIEPNTEADCERLALGLQQLVDEDPALRVHGDQQTGQVVIAGAGEQHLEIILDRLRREFKVEAAVGRPQVVCKETFTRAADGEGRSVTEIDGRRQHGHVKIHLFPGEAGTGYVFENTIVAASIPSRLVKPIAEGIEAALARGTLAGYPIDDVRIELYDGSYDDVDSSETAFKIAGARAFQDAATKAGAVVVEPMMRVEVVVPKEYVGDVLGSLTDRRGRILSEEDRGGARIVQARVPLSKIFGYQADLRSRTRGRATFSLTFDRYQPRPGAPGDDDPTSSVGAPRR